MRITRSLRLERYLFVDDSCLEPQISRRRTDGDDEFARLDGEFSLLRVVESEGIVVQAERHVLRLAFAEEHFAESLQLLGGAGDRAFRVGDVELGDFRGVGFARVRQVERYDMGIAVARDREVRIVEGRVAQAVAERVERFGLRAVVAPVADEDAFVVGDPQVGLLPVVVEDVVVVIVVHGVVFPAFLDGDGQAAAG